MFPSREAFLLNKAKFSNFSLALLKGDYCLHNNISVHSYKNIYNSGEKESRNINIELVAKKEGK
jgi:hypothetical protein